MTAPTARQLAIVEWMRAYQREHAMPPTLREIGAHFGIRSTNGVHDHLVALEKKGLARSRPVSSRGWMAIDSPPPPVLAPNQDPLEQLHVGGLGLRYDTAQILALALCAAADELAPGHRHVVCDLGKGRRAVLIISVPDTKEEPCPLEV